MLSLEEVCALLKTRDIPGNDSELRVLCIRIGELVEHNGESWVTENRQSLLDQWEYIIQNQIIKSDKEK